SVAVELVEALSSRVVVRIVVVRLGGGDGRLVEELRRPAVPDDKRHVVLVAGRVDQLDHVEAARPVGAHGHGVAGRPAAVDYAGAGVRDAGGLRGAVQGPRMQKQPAAQATVVANPVDVDGEGLGRVDTHVKVEAAALEHARGIRVALDLPVDVVGGAGELPRRRAGFLIFGDDRIV